MTDGLVDARGVGVSIGEVALLRPVSFTVERGRALALTGLNGSGKTTLLRVLAGLTRPTTGTLTVGGRPPRERDARFRGQVAALIGVPALARDLTLREHLSLVRASWGGGVRAAQARADELLATFGIARLRDRFPHELSSGQSQLFTLALTLARPFELLALDEPEQRLDAERLAVLTGVLADLVDAGTTLVFASHNATLVSQLADETLHLTETADEPAA